MAAEEDRGLNLQDRPDADVRDLFLVLLSQKWWLISSACVLGILFGVLGFVSKPIYRAKTQLIAADHTRLGADLGSKLGGLAGLASIAGFGTGSDTQVEEALAVLRSRKLAESFIEEHHLMPILFNGKWDASRKQWKVDVKPPTQGRAYKALDRIRSVERDRDTGIITLQVEWEDAHLAADWANELVERLNAEMRTRAVAQANASLSYLERELTQTNVVTTRDAISRLIEAQVQERMLANVTEQYAFRVVDPAVASDPDDPVRPHKFLLIILGLFLGLMFGTAIVLVRMFLASLRHRRTTAP
jgi:uncharacterized protein involved in exopolysaccharide biosynthesis